MIDQDIVAIDFTVFIAYAACYLETTYKACLWLLRHDSRHYYPWLVNSMLMIAIAPIIVLALPTSVGKTLLLMVVSLMEIVTVIYLNMRDKEKDEAMEEKEEKELALYFAYRDEGNPADESQPWAEIAYQDELKRRRCSETKSRYEEWKRTRLGAQP